jgi:hypothetical protein
MTVRPAQWLLEPGLGWAGSQVLRCFCRGLLCAHLAVEVSRCMVLLLLSLWLGASGVFMWGP